MVAVEAIPMAAAKAPQARASHDMNVRLDTGSSFFAATAGAVTSCTPLTASAISPLSCRSAGQFRKVPEKSKIDYPQVHQPCQCF
jgi:hypothetical protein